MPKTPRPKTDHVSLFIPEFTGFSYVTNNIHCGMAHAKLTRITLCMRRESALNNKDIIIVKKSRYDE